VTRRATLLAGFGTLLFLWAGPLPALADSSFAAHMALHLGVVALAAPLLAHGLADIVPPAPPALSAPAAATLEMVVVWAWHAPVLCAVARRTMAGHLAEQASWVGVGLLLWMSVTGRARDATGPWGAVVALLFTAMHMALLGALIAFAPRPLYPAAPIAPGGLTALADQQLGGILMLAVGGTVYLAAALAILNRELQREPAD
jgi:putative membrane protein